MVHVDVTDLTAAGARTLRTLLDAGETSCVEVVTAHLDRADRVDPALTALVGRRDRDEVLAEARERDAELRAGRRRGALHGLPHGVKDLAQAAGLPWTAGSPLFADRVGVVDDPAVARVRAAGAVVVAKTNVPEFGFGSQTYNPVWGPTRNPWDRGRTVGGSSGGAAAALAARLLPLADGSDVGGSLRNPAAFANVLGMRPSRGRVPAPASGFVAGLGELGPMAREVDDLAMLLEVMAGPEPSVPLARTDALGIERDEHGAVRPADLRGARVAWAGDLGGRLAFEPGVLDLGRGALAVLADQGAEVVDLAAELRGYDLDRLWRAFLTWRAWSTVPMRPLLADPALRDGLKPEAVWEIERGLELDLAAVEDAMAVRAGWYARVVELFGRVDLVVAPSTQVFPFDLATPWPREIAGVAMDSYLRWMETVVPWSMAGVPALAVPAGFDPRGLPTGVQIIGPPGADARVLAAGAAYERATRWVDRRPPEPPAG